MEQITTAALIAQYIKLRDKRDQIKKDYVEAMEKAVAPYDESMQAIEGNLTEKLLGLSETDEGRRNISTDAGVVFRTKWTRVKVEDREEFLKFVFNIQGEAFLTNHIAKEPVIEWMDEHNGNPPPGVHFEAGWQTVIRRK